MQSKFVTVEGIRLAYLDRNPENERAIIFIHGNSSSAATWRRQFGSELLSCYRLLAFDMPAHGGSAVSGDYSLPGLGRLLSMAVRQVVGSQQFILCGISLGVNVVAEMLGEVPGVPGGAATIPGKANNLKGLVALGSCALGDACTMEVVFNTGVDMRPSMEDSVTAEELQQYWAKAGLSIQEASGESYRLFEEDYFKVQDNFRSKMFASVGAGRIGNEIGLLRTSGIPVLAVFGAEERVCNIHYLDEAGLRLWQNKVFKLADAGHFVHIDRPETINELVGAFAKDCFI